MNFFKLIMTETRPIPQYPDYKITSDGKIFNKYGREMKQQIGRDGYYKLELWKNKKAKTFRLHRLLALTFLPNFYGKSDVDHKNRNKSDNRLINLRWATRLENQQNRGIPKNNTSGHQNIHYCKTYKKWKFSKVINKKKYSKKFKTIEEAIIYKKNKINSLVK